MFHKYNPILAEIRRYWAVSASGFSEFIRQDLSETQKEKWRNKIIANAPPAGQLEVLDLGTGAGLFPIILGEAGHLVTAVDCTGEMLAEAEKNAALAGVEAAFFQMDSHQLNFDSGRFDLVVCRNLVWTLYDPFRAYNEWKRVLKRGGRIIIFDANYGRYCFDEAIARQKMADEELYRRKYGEPVKLAVPRKEYIDKMYLSDKTRPQWDEIHLKKLGLDVRVEDDVSGELRTEPGRLLNSTAPLFMIVAEKIDD